MFFNMAEVDPKSLDIFALPEQMKTGLIVFEYVRF